MPCAEEIGNLLTAVSAFFLVEVMTVSVKTDPGLIMYQVILGLS